MANILVIEDDEQLRGMLTQMLSQDKHRVSIAKDGEEGLRLARDNKPELVITDILMPKMDGIEFIMELNRLGNSTPVIAISGGRRTISADFNLDSATLIGVKATIAKPFSLVELRQAISKALN